MPTAAQAYKKHMKYSTRLLPAPLPAPLLGVASTHLWHVANSWTGHTGTTRARPSAQHPNLARIETPSSDNAAEQRCLATARGAQEAITARERKNARERGSERGKS